MFEAKQSDPIEESAAFESLHEQWQSSYRQAKNTGKSLDSVPERPGIVQGEILSKIEHKLSHRIYSLICSPYWVRVKILENYNLKKYNHPDSTRINSRNNREYIHAIIEEVVSGQSCYSKGDTIDFKLFQIDREGGLDFQEGEDCFVPLEPRVYQNVKTIVLTIYLDEDFDHPYIDYGPCWSCGRYPVDNGILIDRKNTFGLGTKIKWSEFVKTIKDEIQKIKSW
jgi:hypothetical protein